MTACDKSLLMVFSIVLMVPATTCLAQDYWDREDKGDNRQVESLRSEVKELRAEIREFRAGDQESWLTKQRSAEMKAHIADLIADADSRTSLMDGGLGVLTAGHDGNVFYVGSADGNFLMNINGLLQFRWIGNFRGNETGRDAAAGRTIGGDVSTNDNTEMGFEFRRVELVFSGHIFDPDLGYVLVLAEDGTGGITAQDVVISYKLTDNWSLAVGRYFAPLLREELMGGGGSQAIALSYMNNELSVGRGEGISLRYEQDSFKVHAFLSDGGAKSFAAGSDLELTVRGDVKLAGDWGSWGSFTAGRDQEMTAYVGGAFHYAKGETGDLSPANNLESLFSWTIDGSVQYKGWNFYGALAGESSESDTGDIDNYGFVAQGGYMVTDNWEPFLRYEYMSFDNALGYVSDSVSLITFGTNYHVNERLKLAFDVVFALDPIPTDSVNAGILADGVEDGQIVVRAQTQLKF